MGFIAGCCLIAMIIFGAWEVLTKREARRKLLLDVSTNPIASLVTAIGLVLFVMCFLGIFIPIFGDAEIGDSGWKVWEIGAIGTLVFALLMLVFDFEKLGKK